MARHYYVAEPFPDELIGSVLIRTARHRGLGIKDFTALLGYTKQQSKLPLFLTQYLSSIANATKATPLELLHFNTPFRYITAFMSPQETDRFAANIIDGSQGSLASLVQSVTIGGRRPRFCPVCIKEDLATFGDSYWHRKHNLPFVDSCHRHNTALHELPHCPGGFAVAKLPEDYSGIALERAESSVSTWLTEQSIATLETRFRRSVEDWFGIYRDIAFQRCFPREATGLCAKSLSDGLQAYFGEAFFKKLNWSFRDDGKNWAALMLRDGHSTALVTGKHLVVQAFLKFAPVPAKAETAKPGRKDRNYGNLDQQFYRLLQRRMSQEAIRGRPSAHLMMRELGIWETYKHQRRMLPKTNALVADWYEAFVALKKEGQLPKKAELRERLTLRLQQEFQF